MRRWLVDGFERCSVPLLIGVCGFADLTHAPRKGVVEDILFVQPIKSHAQLASAYTEYGISKYSIVVYHSVCLDGADRRRRQSGLAPPKKNSPILRTTATLTSPLPSQLALPLPLTTHSLAHPNIPRSSGPCAGLTRNTPSVFRFSSFFSSSPSLPLHSSHLIVDLITVDTCSSRFSSSHSLIFFIV
jgi:hypothetical protein